MTKSWGDNLFPVCIGIIIKMWLHLRKLCSHCETEVHLAAIEHMGSCTCAQIKPTNALHSHCRLQRTVFFLVSVKRKIQHNC